jgi:hypothetical protein
LKQLHDKVGEVRVSPSSYTILGRLRDIVTALGGVVLSAGSAIIGKVGIDQTTDGTTNKVSSTQSTHDNLNCNANLQQNNADIASGNPLYMQVEDGKDVTLGAKADARSTATDTTAITAMQVLKQISYMLQNPATLPIGSNVIGKTSIDQTTDGTTNKVQARNATHGDFQVNATLQINDTDVSDSVPIPTRDIGYSTLIEGQVTMTGTYVQVGSNTACKNVRNAEECKLQLKMFE